MKAGMRCNEKGCPNSAGFLTGTWLPNGHFKVDNEKVYCGKHVPKGKQRLEIDRFRMKTGRMPGQERRL